MPRSAAESAEAQEAQKEAAKGAGVGAVKWGAASAVLGGLGWAMSPVYRGLTIQFKVYIHMSMMILGGMIEADSRVRRYEHNMRLRHMIAHNRAMYADLEDEDFDDGPPPAATSGTTSSNEKRGR
ncbi:hypothetical protein F4777DRAFT_26441 [Nemania sp. FL0916]|nr:hypothetical protein F4777DRAFT_26441 [Nemania sp. FL0916]